MESNVTEIAPDTYRISTFHPGFGIQFNQFLIKDDEPFLMHTGFKEMFPTTLQAVTSIIDPARLRWIGFSHFESDECGALNKFLGVAPHAQAVCSVVGAMVTVNDFADRAPRSLADKEVLQTGRHHLQFLATPHVPHCWDAGFFFDQAERTLLCSDLFFHPGDPEPLIETDIVGRARDAILGSLDGPLANDMPYTPYTHNTLERLAALEPATLAVMHGSSFRGGGGKAILDLAAVLKAALGQPEGRS
ncbi:MAG: MBL fold metallo-hydrolase [Chromatiales bacterium]|jgi:flavorubredoxin|nr:MAG: MBL fold metallo-hydrolase [Chromatiales bacterium]